MDFLIETKKDEEMFEEYEPDTLYLRVIKHVEEWRYDFSKLDLLPTQVISVNKKKETVEDLNNRLAEVFDIPVERLVVFLRHEHVYNHSVRTELYNIEWRKNKSIEEASGRLDHGTILYVEEADPKQ